MYFLIEQVKTTPINMMRNKKEKGCKTTRSSYLLTLDACLDLYGIIW